MTGKENIQGYWNTSRHTGNRKIPRVRAFEIYRKDYSSIKMPASIAEFTLSNRIMHALKT